MTGRCAERNRLLAVLSGFSMFYRRKAMWMLFQVHAGCVRVGMGFINGVDDVIIAGCSIQGV